MQPTLLVIFAFFAVPTFANDRIDLRPVANSTPTPTPVSDPYFGFGAPSKNPADYASDSAPTGNVGRQGVPVQYMGPAATQVGNMQSSSALQSYNSGLLHGPSSGSAPSPGMNAPAIPVPFGR